MSSPSYRVQTATPGAQHLGLGRGTRREESAEEGTEDNGKFTFVAKDSWGHHR